MQKRLVEAVSRSDYKSNYQLRMSIYYNDITREERLSGLYRSRTKGISVFKLWRNDWYHRFGIYCKFGNIALVNLKFFPQ